MWAACLDGPGLLRSELRFAISYRRVFLLLLALWGRILVDLLCVFPMFSGSSSSHRLLPVCNLSNVAVVIIVIVFLMIRCPCLQGI